MSNRKLNGPTLIENARIFDGASEHLIEGTSVFVEDNTISRIGSDIDSPDGTTILDADGQTLMPGLIDAHYHTMLASLPLSDLLSSWEGYINLMAAKNAESLLLQGFTTVRDPGGNAFSLKRAIDNGHFAGPRIYPSGPIISQTSGHADFRPKTAVPVDPSQPLTYLERNAHAIVADGVPEVTKRVREVLRMGASQIKLAAGGGVASDYDPLDVSQYTLEELEAAVDVAETWNTYVTVHAYTPDAIQTAIRAGVRCIEHGQMMDEETAALLSEEDVWLSTQPFLDDEDAIPFPEGSDSRQKQLRMVEGTEQAYSYAREYDIKTAFGTDTLFSPELAQKTGKQLAKLEQWYTPFEVLKMATSDNAELLKMSGPRDPYDKGKIGVLAEDAYADLLLVDGDPLEDVSVLANPDENLTMVMKDGTIYKNVADE
ncbi:metal-dependent hydrolase family protein [Halorarius halobius]|uniref:metal-dependent hydrolase family protein n=1 Tax=Halorarius halobius TaxID=2962671 RepID=UPI0020CDBF63|nr:amidohydrolase family protein [Halorarius halobius]